ncbi:hypothetical protein MANES_06G004700v8 [Manihot esculenta]|uniref:Uncharacterized protein n=1 Tax=Manihot esculenta TaxID=3983 RepID=A0ACB7HGF1_MANES|nr:hypothetical protein MANES_06G004700v8 [Manihot esculenta]
MLMAIVTGDRYLEKLVNFVEHHAGSLIDGSLVLKVNPAGLHYVQSRLDALHELESLLSGAPVDYLRAYISDLGDHRALEQLRRILRFLPSLKVVSVLPPPIRDPTPLCLLRFERLKVLELRGCDLSTSAARGLLELRHTLEKIICHNSTDALRHVFASRIAEIKKSPQWNRLSFVSCALNRLVLMDESLQLLPAVETLDLSRNKFEKVDNLWKCTKLKHLDLGFNHLRTVAPCIEVSCHIVKLVLRNNALTTLRGLEKLKSLEGLDVSYNIISKFSELECLASLTSLQNLWLEGNPLCCARWYRAQVFSYFSHLDTLKLDDREISRREIWKRQIIIASRQKRPSSYGFYCPAKDDAQDEGCTIRKKRKVSRLAAIERGEENTYFSSDQESPSCNNDLQSKEENGISDNEADIVDLINRVELMKRKDSILWLRDVKEWMDHESENSVDGGMHSRATLHHVKENHLKRTNDKHDCEGSRNARNSLYASGDETSTDGLESDASFGGMSLPDMGRTRQKYKKSHSHESLTIPGDHGVVETGSLSSSTVIDDRIESHFSSVYPGSPPHYQADILHHRHNLMEEILQLSTDSYSVVSSDSDTSSSEDDIYEYEHLAHEDRLKNEEYLHSNIGVLRDNQRYLLDSHDLQTSIRTESSSTGGEIAQFADEEVDYLEKTKSKRGPRRRVISLSLAGNWVNKTGTSGTPRVEMDTSVANEGDEQGKQIADKEKFQKNSRINETCRHYLHCNCVIEPESLYKEREVALLLSSANKLYVLLIGVAFDGSGNILSLLGWHRVEDVKEILVGLGLQVVRVCIERGATYLFLTRSIEKSQQLLYTLQAFGPCAANDKCILRSLEQVQVELFRKQICGGSKMSIFQYAMVLSRDKDKEESWLPRSLFISGAHVFLCGEELKQFKYPLADASTSPYFSLDWCCCITDVSKLVIESRESLILTLILEHATRKLCSSSKAHKDIATIDKENTGSSLTSKLKWFSEESLFNFLALLSAIHSGVTTSALLVTCV